LNQLREKVYLRILDDCDDPSIMNNETLMQACLLFDEFSADADLSRVVKEVYN
jgi:hypothetical protein